MLVAIIETPDIKAYSITSIVWTGYYTWIYGIENVTTDNQKRDLPLLLARNCQIKTLKSENTLRAARRR